jgi:hypothetical protein
MAAAASGQPARLRLHLTLQSRDANASPQPDTGNMYANQPGTMFPFFKKQKKKPGTMRIRGKKKRNMERALCRKDRKVEKIYLPPPESRHMQ